MENQDSPTDAGELEILSPAAAVSMERATIDMQVATAKRYPRSIEKFMSESKSMIGEDPEVAEMCNYKLKRREADGGTKIIEGPSIRLMEIAASAFGNLRYGSNIIGEEGNFVTCRGQAFDLQRNVAVQVDVRRRISGKHGRYSDDMIAVTCNAAGAIARRNALNGVIPRTYVNQLSEYAKHITIGDIKSLPERRQKAFDFFTKTLMIPLDRVLAYLEKPSVEDCDLEDLELLTGVRSALKNGETTIEREFPLATTAKAAFNHPEKDAQRKSASSTTTPPATTATAPANPPAQTQSAPQAQTTEAATKRRGRPPGPSTEAKNALADLERFTATVAPVTADDGKQEAELGLAPEQPKTETAHAEPAKAEPTPEPEPAAESKTIEFPLGEAAKPAQQPAAAAPAAEPPETGDISPLCIDLRDRMLANEISWEVFSKWGNEKLFKNLPVKPTKWSEVPAVQAAYIVKNSKGVVANIRTTK